MTQKRLKAYQATQAGKLYVGKSEELLTGSLGDKLKGQVQLIFTSPPFPLNEKKKYGNFTGEKYIQWLTQFAPIFADLLKPNGSIVIELGNAWEPGKPLQSLLPLQSLMSFAQHDKAGLSLCQEFICHNPARLPSPAQWVTIERIRVTDSYTRLWWMAKTERPKASNKNVLRPYGQSMQALQQRGSYNDGVRPSGHRISKNGFLKDNGGSIHPNVVQIEPIEPDQDPRLPANTFSISHTTSNDYYHRACKEQGIETHPARMPLQLVDFFIQFLTDENDLVLDPFAGSNATGFCAERTGRQWVSIEAEREYAKHSIIGPTCYAVRSSSAASRCATPSMRSTRSPCRCVPSRTHSHKGQSTRVVFHKVRFVSIRSHLIDGVFNPTTTTSPEADAAMSQK